MSKDNAKTWSRADLFSDSEKVEEPYFEIIDAKIPLRRLSEGEWSEIDALTSAGTTFEGSPPDDTSDETEAQRNMQMKVDVEKSVRGERLARQKIVAQALSVQGEKYTIEDVRAITNVQLVEAIAGKVRELSGAQNEQQDEIKRVREEQGGGADSVDEPAGVSTSEPSELTDKRAMALSGGGASKS